jgi:hypothetical protein
MTTLSATAPFRGVNTSIDASKLQPTEATIAINVDLDRGTIRKRDGFAEVHVITGSDAILGIHDFRRDNASEALTLDHLFKVGAKLYRSHNAATPAELQFASGNAFGNSTEVASFVTHEDRTYMVENEAQIRATDGADVRNAVLPRPATPTVAVTDEATSPLVGRFTYKVTLNSLTSHIESAASNESAIATVGVGQKVTIGNLPTSDGGDNRITSCRIYRRNLDGHSEWHFIHENTLAEGPDKDDTKLDSDLHSLEIAPLSIDPTFPNKLRMLAKHNDQLFAAGDTSQLYFSPPLAPHSLADYVIVGGDSEAGKITGLLSWKGSLIIFKQHSIWVATGSSQADFAFKQIVNGTGCFAPHSIIATDNTVYFLGEDGFYAFDGKKATLISRSVSSDIQGRNFSRDNYVVGVDDKERRAVIWAFSSAGTAYNDKILVLFYGNSVEAQGPSWVNWSVSGTTSSISSLGRVTLNETTADRLIFAGFANSKVGKLDTATSADLGTPVVFQWKTGKWDAKFPHRQKSWAELYFEQVKQTDSSNLTVKYYRDADTSPTVINADTQDPSAGTIATTMPVAFVRLRERARDLAIEFSATNQKPIEIVTFSANVDVAGRSH